MRMMTAFLSAAVLAALFIPAHGMGNRKALAEIKAQVAENIKVADTVNSRVAAVENATVKLADRLDQQNAAVAGVNNQIQRVSTEVKAGRDAIVGSGNHNEKEIFIAQLEAAKAQAKIWEQLFYWVLKLVVVPLFTFSAVQSGRLWWVTKRSMKEMSNARFYQTQLAAFTDAETMDKVMQKKREIDTREGVARLLRYLKKETGGKP